MNRPFGSFFKAATGFQEGPREYQVNLAERQRLPDILAVPTGCGKTAAAVLSWAWRRRECPDHDIRRRTPRRLVYCLPMRSLVEQVHGDVIRWFDSLGWLSPTASYRPCWSDDAVPVFRLMGGEEAEEWEGHPEREAVLVGTQDMLLSRALNRGYAMKPYYWPIAFGLINVDTLWILDEVQIMGAGRTTSVQLHRFRPSPQHLPRESLWMSATTGATASEEAGGRWTQPAPPWMRTPEHGEPDVTVLGLENADRTAMSDILTGPKRVECTADTVEAEDLPERLLGYASGGRLVLAMVNRVARARALFSKVRALVAHDDETPEVLLLHSRFRPRERTAAMTRLMEAAPSRGRIAISTQVLEAGVDLDADVLVSEICPWPSLVQRLGRLNRRGTKDGVARILEVPIDAPSGGWPSKKPEREQAEEEARRGAALPYEWEDLEAAWRRAVSLSGDASIKAIESINQADPYTVPVEGPVLRRHHIDDHFETDLDLSGGHRDVSRFIRSDRMDLDVAVLWRALDDHDPENAPENAPAPHPDEICKAKINDLRNLGRNKDKQGWLLGFQRSRRRSAWRNVRLGDPGIRPGDTVMLNVSVGGYDDQLGWVGSENSRPSCWVSNVGGRRSWVRSDGSPDSIDDRTIAWAGLDGDPRSHRYRWMELSRHLATAESEARQLAEKLVPHLTDELATAARWHDVGKALERRDADGGIAPFQKMLREAGSSDPPDPRDDTYYAKSNSRRRTTPDDHRFRHEVASALAYLTEKNADDLVAWLIMAHHGKVRMMPTPWNDQRLDDVAGVRPGDRIPARAMSFVAREEARALDPDLLLPSLSHPGWQGRAVKLRTEHGPQFLAYLEALIRVADWRSDLDDD